MRASARVSGNPYKPSIRRVASWEDVSQLVEHFSYHRNIAWLFRGVSNTGHDLVPLIGRRDWRKPDPHERGPHRKQLAYSKKDELAVFAMFQNTAVAHLHQQPA